MRIYDDDETALARAWSDFQQWHPIWKLVRRPPRMFREAFMMGLYE